MKSKLRDTIEISGIIGLIASLVFVGIQLMLDRNVALGSAYQERAESRKADLRSRFESELYAADLDYRIANDNYRPGWWNSDIERIHTVAEVPVAILMRIYQTREIDLITLDNVLYQNSVGLIEESLLESMARAWSAGTNDPIMNAAASNVIVRADTKDWLKDLGYQFEN